MDIKPYQKVHKDAKKLYLWQKFHIGKDLNLYLYDCPQCGKHEMVINRKLARMKCSCGFLRFFKFLNYSVIAYWKDRDVNKESGLRSTNLRDDGKYLKVTDIDFIENNPSKFKK